MTRTSSSWTRPVWSLAGLLVAYYAFPVDFNKSPGLVVLSLAAVLVGLGVLGWTMVMELNHLRHGEDSRSTVALAMLLLLLLMAFSLTFFMLERASPGQIAGLHTRTDALYFTVSTMATVGYGDVHATGQAARALVCAVIVFDIVVVTSLVRAHMARRSNEL